MKATDLIDNDQLRDDIPRFAPGDELKVHVRVVEGNKERVQVFQGNVIARQGGGLHETYTVRKLSYGVGVERTFPLHTPTVTKIEVVKRGDVRRAKLYFLRDLKGKAALLQRLARANEVQFCYEITGPNDLLALIDCDSMHAFNAVADRILSADPIVRRYETHFVKREVKFAPFVELSEPAS